MTNEIIMVREEPDRGNGCTYEITIAKPEYGVCFGRLTEDDLKGIETAISSYLNGNDTQ